MHNFTNLGSHRFINYNSENILPKKNIIFLLLLMSIHSFALENPSFEASDPLQGWQCVAFNAGQAPSILADCNNFKQGHQSLLITSKDPSDIAIVQKISLPPDSLWHISCWIQTENLNATDQTTTAGALHIRTMDNLSIAETPSIFGTSPWKKQEVLFRVPLSGQANVVLFYVGFGKGTGKAWFDDICLEKIADAPTEVPVTGRSRLGVKLFDEVMLKYREKIGCTAATLAVSKAGNILYRRGYGWQDREKTIPTDPDTMIGIASCGKPVTAAGIRYLAKHNKLKLDAKLFDLLHIKPQGPVIDKRINDITINHLLENKAGWGYDPWPPAAEMARQAGFKDPIPIEIILGFIMTRPLEDAPGSTAKYCNFGWDILLHIIEKFSGQAYSEYICTEVLGIHEVKGMHDTGQPLEDNDSTLIWNDAAGGPISASTRTLCRFMEKYWLTGEPRDRGNPYWVMYGSLDGSTAMMVWRSDGFNLVALFNGRCSNVGHNEIKDDLEKIIDEIKDKIK